MQSRILTVMCAIIMSALSVELHAQYPNPSTLTECSSVAVYKYKPPVTGLSYCKITVDRSSPGSPLPVQVPKATRVVVVVDNQYPHEILHATVTNDAVAKPDVFGNAVSKLSGPLASLVIVAGAAPAVVVPGSADDIKARQITNYNALRAIYRAYIEPTCLQAYVQFNAGTSVCTGNPIASAAAFETAKDAVITDLRAAIATALPTAAVATLDGEVKTLCPTAVAGPRCPNLLTNEARIDALLSLLTIKGTPPSTTLQSLLNTLVLLPTFGPTPLPVYTEGSDRKLTIAITAVEQIGSTSTNVASVVITWQQTNWSLSTGVVLSALKNKSYANSPIYNPDGTPSTDGMGHTYTMVTVSKTYPGIISPVFLANYRLYNFQGASGRWAILFSGGIGANIASKSADFAAGPSVQFGSVIFTPCVHYGRQTQLSGGVHVGDQLGTSPPALPTSNPYKPAVGLGITWKLPFS